MDPVLTANLLMAVTTQIALFWVVGALTVPIMNAAWKRGRGHRA